MPISPAQLLLITDDTAEESHASHILGKYNFTNSIVILRNGTEARKYFAACAAPDRGPATLPEAIILSLRDAGRPDLALCRESRRGALAAIPLIVAAETREEEEAVRGLGLPRTTSISRPIGFFKLLEAMQKLGMRWIVLRPLD